MQYENARARGRRRAPVRAGDTSAIGASPSLASTGDAYHTEDAKRETDAGEIASVSAGAAEGIAGADVGILRVNDVELDPVALDAEADRILADPAAVASLSQADQVLTGAAPCESWSQVTPGIVVAADLLLLPQWNLQQQEKDELSGAIAGVLDQLFPGGMSDARWAPYFRLVAISVAVGVSRRDPETGKFPPLGPKRVAIPNESTGTGAVDRKAA